MTLLNIITALKSTGSNIKKYLTKDILILVLILTTVIGGYSTLNTCKRLQVSQQENDELAILNTYNIKQRAKLDSLTLVLKKIINERDALIVLKDKKIISQTLNIAKLKESNKQHVFDIKPLTSDSSYKYLQSRIPAIAELRYPFDSSQVKDIHATYIAKDDLDRLNIQLESIVENFKLLSYVQDTQIHDLKRLNQTYVDRQVLLSSDLVTYKHQNNDLTKDVKKQKFLKNLFVGTTGVAIIVALVMSF